MTVGDLLIAYVVVWDKAFFAVEVASNCIMVAENRKLLNKDQGTAISCCWKPLLKQRMLYPTRPYMSSAKPLQQAWIWLAHKTRWVMNKAPYQKWMTLTVVLIVVETSVIFLFNFKFLLDWGYLDGNKYLITCQWYHVERIRESRPIVIHCDVDIHAKGSVSTMVVCISLTSSSICRSIKNCGLYTLLNVTSTSKWFISCSHWQ